MKIRMQSNYSIVEGTVISEYRMDMNDCMNEIKTLHVDPVSWLAGRQISVTLLKDSLSF